MFADPGPTVGRAIALAACLALGVLAVSRADDSRKEYAGPWDLASLRAAPAFTFEKRGPKLSSLFYANEPYRGRPTRVFAYYARPEQGKGPFPAMVLVHGGGGKAFPQWAGMWADRGYAALAMDLGGVGPDGKRTDDAGPAQGDVTRFQPDELKDVWSYHAVAAVVRGVSLLAAMPEVDSDRIGITGISWGGYLTCIVAGLDDRLKVAVPVYGCGFIHENSAWIPIFRKMPDAKRRAWIYNYEPSRYLAQCRMPVLFVNGTNDFAYPLDSYQKSYRLVGNRTLCVTVKMPHGHQPGWKPREIGIFVDQHLRGGKSLQRVESVKRRGSQVKVKFSSEFPIEKAALHCTTDACIWPKRKWQTSKATLEGGTATAVLPETRPIVYFVTLTDSRGATVSTEHEALE